MLGKVGEIIVQEALLKILRGVVNRIGGKKNLPSILFLFLSVSLYAQYPINTNKQRLGFQTTADGLVWRGSLSDTSSIQPVSNQYAWVILDTVNLKFYSFDFTSNVWNQVGGSTFTQPVDSLFFKTSVPTNNVDTAKMRWDSDLGTVVLGMYDKVPNELGFKNFWLVKNQTGSTITKGSLVYASGTVGSSGRISVSKFIANGTIDPIYLLGITAHDLTDGEDGYVISYGKIRQVNTDTFAAGAILYPSPTTAGVWTDVEPVAPNIDLPIGFCVNSSSNNGTIAIRVATGYNLSELHDVAISSPVANASLYYNGGLWRDTTAALLVSDTATMLANYATKAYADTSGRFYARQDFTNVSSSTLTWTQTDTLVVGGVNVVQVYRNGQILLPTQYTIPTNASVVIGATAYKVGENYTVIFPRGGGAGSGGGSGSLTSISGGTGIIVNPNPITTTGTVSADTSFLFTQSDTLSLNLINRFALKLNAADTASLSSRIDAKGTGTVTSVASGFGLLGGTITTTGTLRLDTTTIYARLQDSINVAIGGDTIKILKQEYTPATSSILTWTITPKFPIQLKAYILVFRNGQLLNNDQYNLTDTNKITIVSTSFKSGANYTVATVSGIGSVGSAQAGNPVYPEAGIALSTGSTWASSITNNSTNWNTAYDDKINSLAVTGTATKTITLTQQDGGTVSGTFSDNGTVTSVGLTAPTGFDVGNSPITSSGNIGLTFSSGYSLPTNTKQSQWDIAYNDKIASLSFTGTDTKTLTLNQTDGGTVTGTFTDLQGVTSVTGGTGLTGGTITTTGTLSADTNFLLTRYDTSAMLTNYLRTGVAASTYLPLTGGTITGDLSVNGTSTLKFTNIYGKNTYTPFNAGIGEQSISNVGSYLRGGTVMIFPDSNLVGSSANLFLANSNVVGVEYSAFGSGLRNYSKQGGDNRRNSFALYTSDIGQQNTNRLYINYNGDIGINDDTPSYKLDVNGTLNATGAATLSSTLAVTGNITEGGNNVLNNLDTVSLSNRINNKVTLTGDETITGTKTFTTGITTANLRLSNTISGTNYLIGYNNSGGAVGQITVGSGLNLTSDVLTATQIDTTSLSNRINAKVGLTGNETIAGTKTFSGNVILQNEIDNTQGYLKRGYLENGTTSLTVGDSDTWIRLNNPSTITITLPSASSFTGREIHILNVGNGSCLSANTNVVDITGNLGFVIFGTGGGKWATLVSTGTYWQIMQSN